MKKLILVILIYFSGYIVGYNYTKYNIMISQKEWTKGDRVFAILISSGSWFTVISMGIVDGLRIINSNNEKAKW
jgi:hypothetical protein